MRTELPEKWCIKAANKEEGKVLFPFHNGSNICRWEIENNAHYECYANYIDNKYSHSSKLVNQYFEEITFEEFKVLILKEQPLEPNYEVY